MSSRCKTINLAHVSVDTLRKRTTKLQQIPKALKRSSYKECHVPEYIPPPPREIRTARIQVCRPRPMDFVSPPVPCICPPCPICPSRGKQLRSLTKLAFKIAMFYFLLETSTKKNIWGAPDGTSQMVTSFSNAVMRLFKKDPKDPDIFGGERLGLIEPDRIRYKLATLWDKAIVFVFTWSIGVPLQLAHDTFEKIETTLIGDEDSHKHDDHHHELNGHPADKDGKGDHKKETGNLSSPSKRSGKS